MNKFKIGDKIKCVKVYGCYGEYLKLNEIYEVTYVGDGINTWNNDAFVCIKDDNDVNICSSYSNSPIYFVSDRFLLAEQQSLLLFNNSDQQIEWMI